MKKLVFTALAVVAFSAVSIASTVEVKEEVVVKKDVINVSPSCDREQKEAEQDALNNGASSYQAYFTGVVAWAECEGARIEGEKEM